MPSYLPWNVQLDVCTRTSSLCPCQCSITRHNKHVYLGNLKSFDSTVDIENRGRKFLMEDEWFIMDSLMKDEWFKMEKRCE